MARAEKTVFAVEVERTARTTIYVAGYDADEAEADAQELATGITDWEYDDDIVDAVAQRHDQKYPVGTRVWSGGETGDWVIPSKARRGH